MTGETIRLDRAEGIRFERAGHRYVRESDGKELIGVTSLMRLFGLAPDYSHVPEAVLARAASRGSDIHSLIEDYDNGILIGMTPELEAYASLGLDVLASEWMVTDGERVASFIDKVLDNGDGTVTVADLKTTSRVHTDSVAWQCSIYAHLLERMNPGLAVSGIACIHVRDARAKVIPLGRRPEEEVEGLLEWYASGKDPKEWSHGSLLPLSTPEWMPSVLRAVGTLAQAKEMTERAQRVVDEWKEKLLCWMTDTGTATIETEDWKVTATASSQRTTIDTAALKAAFPDIVGKYTRTIPTKASVKFTRKKDNES